MRRDTRRTAAAHRPVRSRGKRVLPQAGAGETEACPARRFRACRRIAGPPTVGTAGRSPIRPLPALYPRPSPALARRNVGRCLPEAATTSSFTALGAQRRSPALARGVLEARSPMLWVARYRGNPDTQCLSPALARRSDRSRRLDAATTSNFAVPGTQCLSPAPARRRVGSQRPRCRNSVRSGNSQARAPFSGSGPVRCWALSPRCRGALILLSCASASRRANSEACTGNEAHAAGFLSVHWRASVLPSPGNYLPSKSARTRAACRRTFSARGRPRTCGPSHRFPGQLHRKHPARTPGRLPDTAQAAAFPASRRARCIPRPAFPSPYTRPGRASPCRQDNPRSRSR